MITDGTIFLTKQEGEEDAGEVKDHKEGEDKHHPDRIELQKNVADKFQNLNFPQDQKV